MRNWKLRLSHIGVNMSKIRIVRPDTKEKQELISGITLELLAQWCAIQGGKTRLQSPEYLEEAQELADYLHIIGYIMEDTIEIDIDEMAIEWQGHPFKLVDGEYIEIPFSEYLQDELK